MKARTELLLYRLGWVAGTVLQPGWRSLDSSFESWAYGSGLMRQIQRLEAQAYLESKRDPDSGERLIRLTEKGRAACRAGSDPEIRWDAEWDGKWRMVIFDVPEMDRAQRARIRRFLWKEGFGSLQQSVWISAMPFGEMAEKLHGAKIESGSLTLMEGVPVGGETPNDLVRAAWNFEAINEAWSLLDRHLDSRVGDSANPDPVMFVDWMAQERRLVRDCLRIDPLLPAALLPEDYKAREIWRKRSELLAGISSING